MNKNNNRYIAQEKDLKVNEGRLVLLNNARRARIVIQIYFCEYPQFLRIMIRWGYAYCTRTISVSE